jgi:hypothetical protein
MRFTNTSRYGGSALNTTLRMAAGDDVVAPIDSPGTYIEPNSNATTEVEFEVPPTVSRVVLRGTVGKSTGEWPIAIP